MPGIVGIISKIPSDRAERELRRMVETMRHESFYESGTWRDPSLGIYVGWSARKGSFCDRLPIQNESRRESRNQVLFFAGEEFGHKQSAASNGNGRATSPDDPSYLLDVAADDAAFPKCLNGRFHGFLINRSTGEASLFNDRYGMHRIYYHEAKEAFYFAAEAKAILAVCPELRRADPKALGEFVSCGCVLEDRTLFQGMHVLPGGSLWRFKSGSLVEKSKYFDPKEWEEQEELSADEYYKELRDVFSRNLPAYFNGREKVAMSLTGGLDTRMIMAWHKAPADSFPCYTFGGTYRDCEDVRIARRIAEICHQPHEVIPIGQDFLSQFPKYAERAVYLSDGCVDVTRSSDLYANEVAREIAPVRMTGNYGTEVLRQLPAMKPTEPAPGLFTPEFLSMVRSARDAFPVLLQVHPARFAAFRQAPWYHYGLLALEQTQVSVRSPYLDNDVVRTAFRMPQAKVAKNHASVDNSVCLRLIAEGNEGLRKIRTDRGIAGNDGSFTAPLVRNFLEFTFKAEYAYDYGMPQWLARIDSVLSPFRPERMFLGRHKFAHYRVWYRDSLAHYTREVLLDPKSLSRPYLAESDHVENLVEAHLAGRRNYTTEIHKLLTLELLHRVFLD